MSKQPSRRGDLILDFDIVFPDKLTQNAKDIISDVLPKT